jgi:hypothetical protein
MTWSYLNDTRHKVFLSYYHQGDQWDKNRFEQLFGHLFINKSVEPGDINTDVSTDYIKRLIQEDYISDTSVVVVLVGKSTWGRKHVDWEISAGLNKKVGGNYSGLLGILIPDFPFTSDGKYYYQDIPPRLADNVKTGYAEIYTWSWVCSDESRIKDAINGAFTRRVNEVNKIDNSREQFDYNRS